MSAILGISAFYHDSAAALIIDGQIIEKGIIILDRDALYKLTTKKIERLRLNGERNIDFNDKEKWPSRYGKFLNDVQDRWKDFTSLYLKDWLNN